MAMMLALGLLLAAQDPLPPPPVTTGSERGSALRLQLTGRLDLHYLNRSLQLETVGALLNAVPPAPSDSREYWSGRISLRTDIEVKDFVSGVIELENRSFESGMHKPFSARPIDTAVQIKQGYIEIGQAFSPDVNVRIGIQDVTLRNRPQDEAFFMDLGESESFRSGFQPAGNFIGNSVDRDIGQATGFRFFYSPFEVLTLQGFWLNYGEAGAGPHDETVSALVLNSLLAEHWSAWLLVAGVVTGGGGKGTIGTLGLGVDGYFGDAKDLELFFEGYAQGGSLPGTSVHVRKEAYAVNGGLRYRPCSCGKLWLEAAYSRRSGDRRAGDDQDQAFQSYENVNRFLILESGEFGLDVDTNVSCGRVGVGLGPFDFAGRPWRFQADVGRFTAVAPVLAAGRRWGIETDVAILLDYNESLSLSIKTAWLGDSELLSRLTGDNYSWLVLFGADLKF